MGGVPAIAIDLATYPVLARVDRHWAERRARLAETADRPQGD